MKSQIHPTPLEEAFTVGMRENKARLHFYRVSADSFPVPENRFQDADLKAYFDAHPDSFHFAQDAARLGYIRIPIHASKADTTLMADFAKETQGTRPGRRAVRRAGQELFGRSRQRRERRQARTASAARKAWIPPSPPPPGPSSRAKSPTRCSPSSATT